VVPKVSRCLRSSGEFLCGGKVAPGEVFRRETERRWPGSEKPVFSIDDGHLANGTSSEGGAAVRCFDEEDLPIAVW